MRETRGSFLSTAVSMSRLRYRSRTRRSAFAGVSRHEAWTGQTDDGARREPVIPGLWEVEFGLGYKTSARDYFPPVHRFQSPAVAAGLSIMIEAGHDRKAKYRPQWRVIGSDELVGTFFSG